MWKQDCILTMKATEYNEKPDNAKSSLLLHCIDNRAREVYNTFNFFTTADSMRILIQEKIIHIPVSNFLLTAREKDSLLMII